MITHFYTARSHWRDGDSVKILCTKKYLDRENNTDHAAVTVATRVTCIACLEALLPKHQAVVDSIRAKLSPSPSTAP